MHMPFPADCCDHFRPDLAPKQPEWAVSNRRLGRLHLSSGKRGPAGAGAADAFADLAAPDLAVQQCMGRLDTAGELAVLAGEFASAGSVENSESRAIDSMALRMNM
jgi:hypothetical protein